MLWYITTHYYSTCFIHDVMHDVLGVPCVVRMCSGQHLSLKSLETTSHILGWVSPASHSPPQLVLISLLPDSPDK